MAKKFKSVGSMAIITKIPSIFLLLFLLLLVSMTYADLKDEVSIIYPYRNESCKSFKVVSKADAPVWVRIEFVYYKDNRDHQFKKIYLEPGEEKCIAYPIGWEKNYSKPFIVAVWYA